MACDSLAGMNPLLRQLTLDRMRPTLRAEYEKELRRKSKQAGGESFRKMFGDRVADMKCVP